MQVFQGKVAVVTGAASGIGLGMTEALASRGMSKSTIWACRVSVAVATTVGRPVLKACTTAGMR